MGKPAARITDPHSCPMVTGLVPHVGGPVAMGSANVFTGKLPQARVGDLASCVGPNDVIAMGSTGVFVNKKPAARMGDKTAHGGAITKGLPTVLIGETKAGGGGGAAMGAGAVIAFADFAAQVKVLIEAAQSGAPFCEICFKKAVADLEAAAARHQPAKAKSTEAPSHATPPAKSPAKPPPVTPPQPLQTAKVCEIISHTISCEHPRTAGPSNILMVVPGSIGGGDTISGEINMKGGCGEHPTWSVSGAKTLQGKGQSYNFRTNMWGVTASSAEKLKRVTPQIYTVQASSCHAGAQSYEVHAYPSGEASFKLALTEFRENFHKFLQVMPVADEEKEKWEKKILVGEMKFSGGWKEDDKSWRAYFEDSFTAAFSPLIGIEHRGQIYPPSLLPGWLGKYFEAGVFLTIGVGADLSGSFATKFWPDTGKSEIGKREVAGGGSGSAKLSLDLKLASKEIVAGSIAGSTGIGFKVAYAYDEDATIEIQPKWDGIKASATLKAAWGLIEINRDFQLVQERTYDKWKWSLTGAEKAP